MKNLLVLTLLLQTVFSINAQEIYVKAFGNPEDKAIIYLHGGPGYNSSSFEITTAEKLSNSGFYVIVYDRRGEGRSTDKEALFNFDQTFEDLNNIYKKYGLKKASLIGHSFGGVIATLYSEKNPQKIESLLLVGAPLSFQETFKTILSSSKEIYTVNHDSINLNYINMIENMDKHSLKYSSYCFRHAMQNRFYSPKNPTEEALKIYSKFSTDSLLLKYASKMTYQAPLKFWENEQYTSLDLSTNMAKVMKEGILIVGLYGKEDGLFSENQVSNIREIIGKDQLLYFEKCSHNVYIDQQEKFVQALNKWLK